MVVVIMIEGVIIRLMSEITIIIYLPRYFVLVQLKDDLFFVR